MHQFLGASPRVGDGRGTSFIDGVLHLVGGSACNGKVAINAAPMGQATLAVIEGVRLATLVDRHFADAFDFDVASVPSSGAASVTGAGVRFAGHRREPCRGANAVRYFTKPFTNGFLQISNPRNPLQDQGVAGIAFF